MPDQNALFRFVHQGGIEPASIIDPETDGYASSEVRELLSVGVVADTPPPEVKQILSRFPIPSDGDLRSTKLAVVSDASVRSGDEVSFVVETARNAASATVTEWRAEIAQLSRSWIAGRVNSRQSADPTTHATLERLLRVGVALMRSRLADDRTAKSIVRQSLSATVVVPKRWRDAARGQQMARSFDQSARPDADSTPRRMAASLRSIRAERALHVRRLSTLDQIAINALDAMVAASSISRQELVNTARRSSGNRWSRLEPAPAMDRFQAELKARTTDDQRQLWAEALQPHEATASIQYETIQQHLSRLAAEATLEANRQCEILSGLAPFGERPHVASAPSLHVIGTVPPAMQILGMGELMLARRQHLRYEAQEIAFIENVVGKEEHVRTHRRTDTTEVAEELETVEVRQTERDLQVSEKFQLENESNRSLSETLGVQAGVTASGTYGTTTVQASAGVQFTQARTETRKQAATLAKEVTQRSAERVERSVRQRRSSRTVSVVDETTQHTIKGPDDPLSAIYKWVQQIHQVELRHYGSRLLLEFFIPEPGARLLDEPRGATLPEPPAFDIGAADIKPDNYLCYARKYGALNITPPPPPLISVGWGFKSEKASVGHQSVTHHSDTSLKIPAGYAPYAAHASLAPGMGRDEVDVVLTIGSTVVFDDVVIRAPNWVDLASAWVWLSPSVPALGESGLPIAFRVAFSFDDVAALAVVVYCVRTPEAMQTWQLATWEQLSQASARQVAAFEQKTQAAARTVPAETMSPLANREREREELRRSAIQIMRRQDFDFRAISDDGNGPVVDWAQAGRDRDIVEFFEQGLEWPQMTWFLRPYFWGRRTLWPGRDQLSLSDPLRVDFLRAGSARVIVPVTPGFERMIMNYLERTGTEETRVWWNDGSGQSLYPEVWQQVITAERSEFAVGSGTLAVANGSTNVTIGGASTWKASDRDISRELYIEGDLYEVADTLDESTVVLNRAFAGLTKSDARYVAGSVRIGSTWEVRTPTNLVVLASEAKKLNLTGNESQPPRNGP